MLQSTQIAWVVSVLLLVVGAYFQRIIIASTTQPQPEPQSPPPSSRDLLGFPEFTTISTPYDEDLIVGLITDLYELLIDLGYVTDEQILWPPATDGHSIDEATCDELHLDPAVRSLIKRLPYPRDREIASDFFLFPDSYGYCLADPMELRYSRNPEVIPHYPQDDSNLDYLLPQDIALSWLMRDGMSVVLDTKENKIRLVDFNSRYNYPRTPDVEPERPDDPEHYRNKFAEDAPTVLRRFLDHIRALRLIPAQTPENRMMYYFTEWEGAAPNVLKKALIEDYGWPNEFRREDWHRDKWTVWEKAIQAAYEELGE